MDKTSETEKIAKPTCPACGSGNIVANRDGESWCRRCGNTWQRKERSE